MSFLSNPEDLEFDGILSSFVLLTSGGTHSSQKVQSCPLGSLKALLSPGAHAYEATPESNGAVEAHGSHLWPRSSGVNS